MAHEPIQSKSSWNDLILHAIHIAVTKYLSPGLSHHLRMLTMAPTQKGDGDGIPSISMIFEIPCLQNPVALHTVFNESLDASAIYDIIFPEFERDLPSCKRLPCILHLFQIGFGCGTWMMDWMMDGNWQPGVLDAPESG